MPVNEFGDYGSESRWKPGYEGNDPDPLPEIEVPEDQPKLSSDPAIAALELSLHMSRLRCKRITTERDTAERRYKQLGRVAYALIGTLAGMILWNLFLLFGTLEKR